jgi:hypothetical protein
MASSQKDVGSSQSTPNDIQEKVGALGDETGPTGQIRIPRSRESFAALGSAFRAPLIDLVSFVPAIYCKVTLSFVKASY